MVSQNYSDCPPAKAFVTHVETDSDGRVVYLGWALPGTKDSQAAWCIQKYTYDDLVTTSELADGNTKLDNVWDDRATLEYK